MSAVSPSLPDPDQQVPLRNWLAVLAVGFGIFALVTSELLPVGLLGDVAAALHVSEGTAGLMVTVPGLVAAVSAPLLTVALARIDRRLVLCGFMLLLLAGSLLSAIAPSFGLLLAARVLVGLAIGGFWPIAGGIAVRLVPERSVGKATSIVFGGVATASVLGVPAGTLLGELGGWQVAFGALGLFAGAVLAALAVLLPPLPAGPPIGLGTLPQLLRHPVVRAGLAVTLLLVSGHFTAYTYVSPMLQEIAGFGGEAVGGLLLLYGAAGIAGNFVAGLAAARDVRRTLLIIALALPPAIASIPAIGAAQAAAVALLVLWGLFYGGVSVALQTWMMKAVPHQVEPASALYSTTFNSSIALGAAIGGLAIDRAGTASVAWIGAGLVLLAAGLIATAKRA